MLITRLMQCFKWINVKNWGIRWLSINFSKPELSFKASELWTEALYFCIEGFRCGICGTLLEEVIDFQIMCLYGSCHSWESKESRSVHLVIPSGKSCQYGIFILVLVIYQFKSHWKIIRFLYIGIFSEDQYAHAVIRSIKTLSNRGDRCFLPAAASLNPRSRIPEHDRFSRSLACAICMDSSSRASQRAFTLISCMPISQLLHVETVCHTACGREADTCCLLHVRSHVEGYLPALEASASGKLQQSRSDSPDIGVLYDCNDTS